jgi:Tol biopolymer transport system component
MGKDRFDVLERFAPLFPAPEPSFERFLRRRERKLRNQRIAAGVVAMMLFVVPAMLFAVLITANRTRTPAAPGPSVPGVPEVDFVIDLNTGEMDPLPRAILRSLGPDGARPFQSPGQYAASPDGSRLAYVGTGDDGSPQIFIASIDGSGVRQVTQHPVGSLSPAWSPDGTRIAYVGNRPSLGGNLFVLDVATGESTKITDESAWGPQFTPDGSSLLYTVYSRVGGVEAAVLRIVPVTGGKGTPLFDPQARGFGYTGEGSLSPDGSLVTFMGHRLGGPGAIRFVANADGTDWRVVGSCISNPAGTWSPDGSRIVCGPNGPPPGIRVIDIATGQATSVAKGQVAIWLDGHRLLVSV